MNLIYYVRNFYNQDDFHMILSKSESTSLDLIRVLASQAVVLGHGLSFFGVFSFLHEPNFPWIQNIAVVIFFILSGFVIAYSTVLKSNKDGYIFRSFFIDRSSRIFSAYIIALIFVALIDYLSMHINANAYPYGDAYSLSSFIANVFMLQDYPLSSMLGINWPYTSFGSARVFWTISIEWWIYMFFGILFFVVKKNENKSLLKITLFAISCIVAVYYMYDSRGGNLSIYWCLGMLWMLAYDKFKKSVSGLLPNLLIFISSIVTCIYIQFEVKNAYEFSFAIFVSVSMVSAINLSNYLSIDKAKKTGTLLASYSFTLYLIHYSVIDFMARNLSINKYVNFFFAFIIANMIAFLISRYSEFAFKHTIKSALNRVLFNKKRILTEW